MTASRIRSMRGEAMFAKLAAAAILIVAAAILVSLQLLAPSPEAHLFDAGAAVSFDRLAAATLL
jgi:hypothetical protein